MPTKNMNPYKLPPIQVVEKQFTAYTEAIKFYLWNKELTFLDQKHIERLIYNESSILKVIFNSGGRGIVTAGLTHMEGCIRHPQYLN